MSEDDPAFVRGELEKSFIVRSRQRGVLDSHNVEVRDIALESA